MNQRLMEEGVRTLLKGIGVDLDGPNYRDTPRRVSKMYRELFSPARNNLRSFPSTYGGIVVLRDHRVVGVCPHHLMPVHMRVYLGYLPAKRKLGLSKLARAVEEHLTGPVLQEDFTERVATSLEERLDPKGVGVVISARHGCMQSRGVRTHADVVTSSMRGVFLNNPTVRAEFEWIIGRVE